MIRLLLLKIIFLGLICLFNGMLSAEDIPVKGLTVNDCEQKELQADVIISRHTEVNIFGAVVSESNEICSEQNFKVVIWKCPANFKGNLVLSSLDCPISYKNNKALISASVLIRENFKDDEFIDRTVTSVSSIISFDWETRFQENTGHKKMFNEVITKFDYLTGVPTNLKVNSNGNEIKEDVFVIKYQFRR